MIFDILTIFPDFLTSPLQEGIIRRALAREQIQINIVNIRDFADDPHAMTDDRPFGGGEGMVMKPEPLAAAVESRSKAANHDARVILFSPQGQHYTQRTAEDLAAEKHLILRITSYNVCYTKLLRESIMVSAASSPPVNIKSPREISVSTYLALNLSSTPSYLPQTRMRCFSAARSSAVLCV